jgi:hypothetical protein
VSELENDANYLTEHQSLEEYAKIEDVYTKEQADSKFLTEHQSLEDYATKAELELKANSADLAAVATSGSYNDLSNKPENVSDFNNDAGYLTEHQDLSAYINGVDYNSTSKEMEFKHNDTVLATIDATPFIKDGMVSNVVAENGNLVITFNTDSGKEPISIPLTEIFNPANY